ncbi:MAG: hypothetical protein Q9159_002468 [Coniocarpon cinnabarinum]
MPGQGDQRSHAFLSPGQRFDVELHAIDFARARYWHLEMLASVLGDPEADASDAARNARLATGGTAHVDTHSNDSGGLKDTRTMTKERIRSGTMTKEGIESGGHPSKMPSHNPQHRYRVKKGLCMST